MAGRASYAQFPTYRYQQIDHKFIKYTNIPFHTKPKKAEEAGDAEQAEAQLPDPPASETPAPDASPAEAAPPAEAPAPEAPILEESPSAIPVSQETAPEEDAPGDPVTDAPAQPEENASTEQADGEPGSEAVPEDVELPPAPDPPVENLEIPESNDASQEGAPASAPETTVSAPHEANDVVPDVAPAEAVAIEPSDSAHSEVLENKNEDTTPATAVSEELSNQETSSSKASNKKAKKVVLKAPSKSGSVKNKKGDSKEKTEKVEKPEKSAEKTIEKPKPAAKSKKNAKATKKKTASAVEAAAMAAVGAAVVEDGTNPVEDLQSKDELDGQSVDTATKESLSAEPDATNKDISPAVPETSEVVSDETSTNVPSAEASEPDDVAAEAEKAAADSGEIVESNKPPQPSIVVDETIADSGSTVPVDQAVEPVVEDVGGERSEQPQEHAAALSAAETQMETADEAASQETLPIVAENEKEIASESAGQSVPEISPAAEVTSTNEARTEEQPPPSHAGPGKKTDLPEQAETMTIAPIVDPDITTAKEVEVVSSQTDDNAQTNTSSAKVELEELTSTENPVSESAEQELEHKDTTDAAVEAATINTPPMAAQEEVKIQCDSIPAAPTEDQPATTPIPDPVEEESAKQAPTATAEQPATMEEGPADQSSKTEVADIMVASSTLQAIGSAEAEVGGVEKGGAETDDPKLDASKLNQDVTIKDSAGFDSETKQDPVVSDSHAATEEYSTELPPEALPDACIEKASPVPVDTKADDTLELTSNINDADNAAVEPEVEHKGCENVEEPASTGLHPEAEPQSDPEVDAVKTEESMPIVEQEAEAETEADIIRDTIPETAPETNQEPIPEIVPDATTSIEQGGDSNNEVASTSISHDFTESVVDIPVNEAHVGDNSAAESVSNDETLPSTIQDSDKAAPTHNSSAEDIADVQTEHEQSVEANNQILADTLESQEQAELVPAVVVDPEQNTALTNISDAVKMADPSIAAEDHKDKEPSMEEPAAPIIESDTINETETRLNPDSEKVAAATAETDVTDKVPQAPFIQTQNQAEATVEDLPATKEVQEAEAPREETTDAIPDSKVAPEAKPAEEMDDTDNRSTAAVCDDQAIEADPPVEVVEALSGKHESEGNVPSSAEEESKASESAILESSPTETEPTEVDPETHASIEKELPPDSNPEDLNPIADTPSFDAARAVPALSTSDKEREKRRSKRRSTAETQRRHHEPHQSDSRNKSVNITDTSKKPRDSHGHRGQDSQSRRHKTVDPNTETDPHLENQRDTHDTGHVKVHKTRPRPEAGRKSSTRAPRTSEEPAAERPRVDRTGASYRSVKTDHPHQQDSQLPSVFGLNALGRVLRPKLFTSNRAQTELPRVSRDMPKQERSPTQEKSSSTAKSPRSPTAPKMQRSQSDQKPSISEEEAAHRAAHARRKERDAEKAASADAARRAARREAHRIERDKVQHRTEPSKSDRTHRKHRDRSDGEERSNITPTSDENVVAMENNETQHDRDQAVEEPADLGAESPPHHHHQHRRHRRTSSYENVPPHNHSEKDKNQENIRTHRRSSYLGEHPRKTRGESDSSGPGKKPEPAGGPVGLLKRIFRD